MKTNPISATTLNELGTVYFSEGKYNEAIQKYQEAIDEDGDFLQAYYNLGLAYTKLGNFSAAISSYQQILQREPINPAANFQLGILFLEENRLSDALHHLLTIEKSHPYHFETQSNLATTYLKLGKIALAKEHYVKALEIQPNDSQVTFNLAVINMQLGLTDIAIQQYQHVLQLDPNFFAAHNNLGVAFLTKNHIPFALKHFKEALKLQPQNAAIEYTVRMLSQDKRLLSSPPEYIKNLFDAYADHYDEHLLKSLDYKIPMLLLDAINKVRPLQKHSFSVLDVGCGTGLCGEIIKPFATKLIGVDLSEKMLEVAKTKHIYDELVCSDLKTFLMDKNVEYDIILAGDVLVYIGDLKEIISSIANSLKPQGLFAFNTEISEGSEFTVNQSGRFTHGKTYLEKLANHNNFSIALYETVITRQQLNQPVYGHLFVFMLNSDKRR